MKNPSYISNRWRLSNAEALLSDHEFDRQWSKPFFDGTVWRSNPPGYQVGFVTSSTQDGVGKSRKAIRESLMSQVNKHPIWC